MSTDTNGDGIADANDGSPAKSETVNGYHDADGLIDTQDLCTDETVNGFEDTDGCHNPDLSGKNILATCGYDNAKHAIR